MPETSANPTVVAQIKALIGQQAYEQAFAPIEQASGLVNRCYWSEEWLALEQEHLFARSWVFAGAAGEIPEPGDIKPVSIAGAPIILVRDQQEIRAFHNVCRHRGATLIDQPCNKSSISCPYHAWNYALDGRLKFRPHFFGPDKHERVTDGDHDPDLTNLVSVLCETWNGCVFVNLSKHPQAFEDYIGPLEKSAPYHDFSSIRWADKLEFEVQANWKLVFENYMEGYHVFSLHPELLKFAPMNLRWSGEWRGKTFYNDYVVEQLQSGRGKGLPHYPGLPEQEQRRGFWTLNFPQFAAEVFPDQFAVLSAQPVAPNLTREELHVFLIGDAATSEEFAEQRQHVMQTWHDLNHEDIDILESLQRGRRSPAYDGGRLSPHWEGPTHQFARVLMETMTTDLSAPCA